MTLTGIQTLSKLEKIERLKDAETRIQAIKLQLLAINSHYFKGGSFTLSLETNDFHNKGTHESIPFDKNLFAEYLKTELNQLNELSDNLIAELTKGKVEKL